MKSLILIFLMASFSVLATEIDLGKSKFKWRGTKVTGEHFGEVPLKSAKVEMKEGKIASGDFVIDLTKMTVTDLQGEWADKFLAHIKNEDFFEVGKYPTARLVIEKDDGKTISGKMTIKDKTNPISISYKKDGKTYSGKMTFDRTKYNIVYGSGNFFKNLGDKVIHDKVEVTFSVIIK